MIINNWFKDGFINKNNNKWNNSREREIILNDKEDPEQTEKKLFFTRTYSLNNSEIDYGTPNHMCSATMNSTASSGNVCQTMNSSGSSSCENSPQQHLSPKQFLEKYSLPRVVKIIPQEPIADSCGYFDPITLLSGQLLMYKHYFSGKVEARSFPNDRKDYSSLVVIPETYKGWFSVVTERGQIKARIYSTIQRLVSAQVTVFLSVSQDLPAYVQTNSDEISTQYTKTNVKTGSVLKLLAVYQDLNSNQSTKSKRLSWPLIGSKQHTSRYAQCLSSSNQVLFINLNATGQFYAVSMTHNSTEENITKVYQIQKLLRTFPLPVRVTIIGSNKNHGSMLLENYHKEHVVLSCVLDGADVTTNETTNEKFRLLEIDVNSKFYVIKPGGRDIDERRLFFSPLVQRAMKFCNDNSEQWISQLKIIHHIYPQNANQIMANQQNVSMEKSKRNRRISIGDKITVKSASFRYSTSYGNEAPRPLIKKQDLEKTNKPKVYDFNYKQTHEFLSLSSNASKDTNSFNHDNSLQNKTNSPMPDISQERVYMRSSNTSSQDSKSLHISQYPLPHLPSSNFQSSELERNQFHQDSRERCHSRNTSEQRKEIIHEIKFKRLTPIQNTSLPNKSNSSTPISDNKDSKHGRQMTSLPNKETVSVHENKRHINVRHSFNHSSVHTDIKNKISRNNDSSSGSSTENSTHKKNVTENSSTKEEISAVERLDRLTQSCTFLSLLNKPNSYQNVSQSSNAREPDNIEDQPQQNVDKVEDSMENEGSDDRHMKQTTEMNNFSKIENRVQNTNSTDDWSPQNIQIDLGPQEMKQTDGKNHQVYKTRPSESQPTPTHYFRQNNLPAQKRLDRNSFSYIHRQEAQEQRLTESKSFSSQSSANSSSNASIGVGNYFSRTQNINQHSYLSSHAQSSSYVGNSSTHSSQSARTQVTTSSSTSSSHRLTNMYSFNSHQNKYISSSVVKKSPVKPAVIASTTHKTHTKTPVPMPRLNVSYSKVHDAIEDKSDSPSSENIYAEINDR